MATTRNRPFKAQLAPFAAKLQELNQLITNTTMAMSADELEALIAATKRPTETNCWFVIFDVAPLVREEAERWLVHRRRELTDG